MVSQSILTAAAVALITYSKTIRAAQCYGLDGSTLDESFQPCNPDALNSPCCATNKADGDFCLTSGLCYAQTQGYQGFLYENGCTDQTGKSEDCLHICPDGMSHSD